MFGQDIGRLVEGLTKIFDNSTDQIAGGIRDASFALESGTFFTLLGPSGCGKTTTLRCIAGLETPDAGIIAVEGRTLFDVKARVNVPVGESRSRVELKPGEVLDRGNGEVRDSIGDGAIRIHRGAPQK